uniref:Uncharacterized protein n=1 Tax=Seriola dumerili TaxID=41447 RepID=A0A3B4UT44_SERDU
MTSSISVLSLMVGQCGQSRPEVNQPSMLDFSLGSFWRNVLFRHSGNKHLDQLCIGPHSHL